MHNRLTLTLAVLLIGAAQANAECSYQHGGTITHCMAGEQVTDTIASAPYYASAGAMGALHLDRCARRGKIYYFHVPNETTRVDFRKFFTQWPRFVALMVRLDDELVPFDAAALETLGVPTCKGV